jgi:hypothetical protein
MDDVYELMNDPGESPLRSEIVRRMAFVDDLSDAFIGTAIPMHAMSTIITMLEKLDSEEPVVDGATMPILVGMDPVGVCVFRAEYSQWYFTPLLRKRPELSLEAAVLDLAATLMADMQREEADAKRWPRE